jgi:hypothetical protein
VSSTWRADKLEQELLRVEATDAESIVVDLAGLRSWTRRESG